MSFLSNPGEAERYADRVARQVPGLHDLHLMVSLLLAEHVPDTGRVLVVGAGGGLELKAMAERNTGWRFDGVDPSADMLQQAEKTLGPYATRVAFCKGYIEDAPEGPFDGATCLLTLHFMQERERLGTLAEIHRRLKPGAPLVIAHHSFPHEGANMDRWLARNAAFVVASGVPSEQAQANVAAMRERLPVLAPDHDVELLNRAGFSWVELFYAAFTFKGWVGYKAQV